MVTQIPSLIPSTPLRWEAEPDPPWELQQRGEGNYKEGRTTNKRKLSAITLPSKLRGKRKVVGLSQQLGVLLADILRFHSIQSVQL